MDDKLTSVINDYEQVTGKSANVTITSPIQSSDDLGSNHISHRISFLDNFKWRFEYAFIVIFFIMGGFLWVYKPTFIYKKYLTKNHTYIYEWSYIKLLSFTVLLSFIIFSLIYAYKMKYYKIMF